MKYLEKQFWLGLKAGANLSKPHVETAYSVLSPTNYDASVTRKKYESFKQMGSQATLEITFYYRGFRSACNLPFSTPPLPTAIPMSGYRLQALPTMSC